MDRQMLLSELVRLSNASPVARTTSKNNIVSLLSSCGMARTVEAVAVLNQLIEAQEKHEADCDRLKAELAEK
jgi:hypothetical protein